MTDKNTEKKQEKKDIIRSEGEGFGVISKTTPHPSEKNGEKEQNKQ